MPPDSATAAPAINTVPWSALAGGVLIGLAAALMVVFLGRIAGISGILGGLLKQTTWASVSQWSWRAAFVLGSGCTSGHGVCGLSRLSLRSLAATLMFMATGALTVFMMRHVLT